MSATLRGASVRYADSTTAGTQLVHEGLSYQD